MEKERSEKEGFGGTFERASDQSVSHQEQTCFMLLVLPKLRGRKARDYALQSYNKVTHHNNHGMVGLQRNHKQISR
jgi:hypothetical protein